MIVVLGFIFGFGFIIVDSILEYRRSLKIIEKEGGVHWSDYFGRRY